MKDLLERFKQLEQRLADQRGEFWLFGLFLREDAADGWDLVISAPWLVADSGDGLADVARHVQSELGPANVTRLSKIVVVKPDNPALRTIGGELPVEHGLVEVRDSAFFGMPMRHAYIITARSPALPAAAGAAK